MPKLHCAHCQGEFDESLMIFDKDGRGFCCVGCRGVYELLSSQGLEEFYQRLGKQKLSPVLEAGSQNINIEASPSTDQAQKDAIYQKYISTKDGISQVNIIIEGIHCNACIWLIEKLLNNLDGILEISLNASSHKAYLEFNPQKTSLSAVFELLQSAGYRPSVFDASSYEKSQQGKRREFYSRLLVGLFGTMNIMWIAIAKYSGYFSGMDEATKSLLEFAEFVLATPVLFYTGSGFFAGLRLAIKQRHASMDSLVAVGASVSYCYSIYAMLTRSAETYFDSVAMIICFVFIGKFLEAISKKTAYDAVDLLFARVGDSVRVLRNGKQVQIPCDELKPAEQVIVRPGEMALVDGKCISGRANFDVSSITGEPLPISVGVGERVPSGGIALDASVVYEASTSFSAGVLGQMLSLLRSLSSQKPKIELLANRIAGRFSLSIITLALGTFCFYAFTSDTAKALVVGVSVLIIACPCALSLATPVASVVAVGTALKRGILFRHSSIIEALASCDTVVFDKTGTLSSGVLEIVAVDKFKGYDETIIVSLCQSSNHPISQAVFKHLKHVKPAKLNDIQELAGLGIKASLGGSKIVAGSARLMQEYGIKLKKQGGFCVAINGSLVAQFWLRDSLRKDAKKCVDSLKKLGLDVQILSGDSYENVADIAQKLGIDNYSWGCLPKDKFDKIIALQKAKKQVLMIGDGINDSAALKAANVSVAMGSGADVSLKSSDLVLLSDELEKVVYGLKLARDCMKTIRQNLGFCFVYNAICVPLAMAGLVIPLFAAIAMSLSSIVVVLNSLRLKR